MVPNGRQGYDAWGKRRWPNGADDTRSLPLTQTTRGFTGQEELSDVGLVHLNGRIYDPLIARMTSADPMVPDPLNGQAWNRYSYVVNNPLAFTDPSGYCFLGLCSIGNIFKEFQHLLRDVPIVGTIVEVAAAAICLGAIVCAVTAAGIDPPGRALLRLRPQHPISGRRNRHHKAHAQHLPGGRHEDVDHRGIEAVAERPRQFVASAHEQETGIEQRREDGASKREQHQRDGIGGTAIAREQAPRHQPDEDAGERVLLGIPSAIFRSSAPSSRLLLPRCA